MRTLLQEKVGQMFQINWKNLRPSLGAAHVISKVVPQRMSSMMFMKNDWKVSCHAWFVFLALATLTDVACWLFVVLSHSMNRQLSLFVRTSSARSWVTVVAHLIQMSHKLGVTKTTPCKQWQRAHQRLSLC